MLVISYNILWTIITRSHSWKIFSEMNVYKKSFREERKEGGRGGGERKIIQTRMEMWSYRIYFTVQLSHLEEQTSEL